MFGGLLSSFGIGGSKSSSSSQGSSSSFVDRSQQPFLDFLRNTGQGIANNQLATIGPQAQQLNASLMPQMNGLLGNLGSNAFLNSLQQQAGGNPALVEQQIEALGDDLARFTNQQLMPGIRRDAVASGGLGGTRQGVAEGLALQGVQDQFRQGAVGLRTADAKRGLQAATAGGGLLAQGSLGGLNAIPSIYQQGLAPLMSQFQPLFAQQQLVGAPTILDKSQSSGGSSGFGFNIGGGS